MDLKNRLQICICCICGIPGSGKTTMCRQLKLKLQRSYLVLNVNFDKILLDPNSSKAQLWSSLGSLHNNQQTGDSIMKTARAQVLTTVEFLLQQMITNDPTTTSITSKFTKPNFINEDVWSHAMDLCWEDLCSCDFDKTRQIIFLIDDNMYLRSMRYELFKKAKLYRTGFCEILVNSSVETAKERNRCRVGLDNVDDDVIERMSQRFEAPDSSKNAWEKFNIVLNTDVPVDPEDTVQMINEAFKNPALPSPQMDEEARFYSQTVCSVNLLHQVDLILRKYISKVMKNKRGSSADMKQLSKQLQIVKENILHQLKKGDINLPDSFSSSDVMDSSKDETSELFKFIENLFCCSLIDV